MDPITAAGLVKAPITAIPLVTITIAELREVSKTAIASIQSVQHGPVGFEQLGDNIRGLSVMLDQLQKEIQLNDFANDSSSRAILLALESKKGPLHSLTDSIRRVTERLRELSPVEILRRRLGLGLGPGLRGLARTIENKKKSIELALKELQRQRLADSSSQSSSSGNIIENLLDVTETSQHGDSNRTGWLVRISSFIERCWKALEPSDPPLHPGKKRVYWTCVSQVDHLISRRADIDKGLRPRHVR